MVGCRIVSVEIVDDFGQLDVHRLRLDDGREVDFFAWSFKGETLLSMGATVLKTGRKDLV
jgi:hypothetical protein